MRADSSGEKDLTAGKSWAYGKTRRHLARPVAVSRTRDDRCRDLSPVPSFDLLTRESELALSLHVVPR